MHQEAKLFESITKEEFEAYEDVRSSGACNMYSSEVRELADIDEATHRAIIRNYGALNEKWPDVRKG